MRRSEALGHMIKRTSMNLDTQLVAEAREVLGTDGTTATVHKALEEVVLRARRRKLAAMRFDFDHEELRAQAWAP